MVEDDNVRRTRRYCAFQLLQFSAADERGRVGFLASLKKLGDDAATSAGGQFTQFGHGLFRRELLTFFRTSVQMSRGSISGDASTRWNRSRRQSPCTGGGIRFNSRLPVGRSPRLEVALGRRSYEKFHSDQEHALGQVSASWQGPGVPFGVHSAQATDRLVL